MPKLTATVGDKKFRLFCHDKDNRDYSIQEQSSRNKNVWNTIDTFGISYYKTPRPFGYLGMSFATAGMAFNEFIEREKRSQAKDMRNRIPHDYPVQPLADNATAKDRATCGTCGLSWDDGKVTGMTPAPAGRCPFEYFHKE